MWFLKYIGKKNQSDYNAAWFFCPQYVNTSKIGLGLKVFRAFTSFFYIIFL